MQGSHRRNPIRSLALSTHPGPSIAVTAIAALLGISLDLAPWRVIVLGFAVLFGQLSVGLSNDWLDAERDRAVGRTDKPVAAGDISIPLVRRTAILTAVAGFAFTMLLGISATIAHAVFIAAGWSYNLWLKRTAFSVLPYLLGFGALPLIVTLSLPVPQSAAWWAMGAGSLLGVAAHFANALPDLDADRQTGVIGLPHRIGARASGIITFAALAVASCLVGFGPGAPGLLQWITLGLESAIVIAGLVLASARPPGRPLFRLVILGALVAVVALILAGVHHAG